MRALAAVYVVLHHIWLEAYPHFPHNRGPWITGWLLYGHLGVAVFIVVSGYSLMLKPAAGGLRLSGGARRFLRYRAWRILPPYWVALIFSIVVTDALLYPRGGGLGYVGVKSALVNGVLLQDVVRNTSPNGAFWSIAVEAQIYLLFPALLWLCRRKGALVTAAVAAVAVTAAHVLADHVYAFHRINNFTPALLILFVFGMAAGDPAFQARLSGMSKFVPLGLGAAFVAAIAILGPETTVASYFTIDCAAGVVVAATFIYITNQPVAAGRRLLSRAPLVRVGAFSYSLYLTHAPIVALVWLYLVHPYINSGGVAFVVEVLIGLPISLAAAYCFFLVFERPFLTRRSFAAWAAFLGTRRGLRRLPKLVGPRPEARTSV